MTTITIKKCVDVEALVCDYFEHINSGYYFGSPEDFLEARLIDILWDCGGGSIPKKSYQKIKKNFLKTLDKQKKK